MWHLLMGVVTLTPPGSMVQVFVGPPQPSGSILAHFPNLVSVTEPGWMGWDLGCLKSLSFMSSLPFIHRCLMYHPELTSFLWPLTRIARGTFQPLFWLAKMLGTPPGPCFYHLLTGHGVCLEIGDSYEFYFLLWLWTMCDTKVWTKLQNN